MLQPDAFCKHKMQQNATAAGSSPRSDPAGGALRSSWFQGSASRRRGGRGKEKGWDGKWKWGGRGRERGEGEGGKLEQGHRLAK